MAAFRVGVQPVLLLFLASTFWGAATVLNKVLLGTIAPITLLFIQLFASSVVLCLLFWGLRKTLPRGRELLVVAALGLLNPGISYTLSMLGLQRIQASTASLLWALEPFMILLLAQAFLRERVTPGIVAAIASGFVGAVLVAGVFGRADAGETDTMGLALLLSAVALCAVYTVSSRLIGQGADPLALVAIQQVAGCMWAAALQFTLSDETFATPIFEVTPRDAISATLTGLMYYAAAYWLYLAALKHVTAGLAGASFNLIPLVAVAGAFVFLGERLSGFQILGAALIVISGMFLVWLTSHPAMDSSP